MFIIRDVELSRLHQWQITPACAGELQQKLACRVVRIGAPKNVRLVGGVDVSISRATGKARAAVVVLNYPELILVEMAIAEGELTFPYVPGLLSFREIPLLVEALHKIYKVPDLVLVDGQGIAHPRRIGLASHLGLLTSLPTIGCAKSRLCGEYDEPPLQVGEYTEIKDKGETIGVALRTRQGCNPVFVSPGHLIGIKESARWVNELCHGYRLPQPVRLAHLAAGGNIKSGNKSIELTSKQENSF